MKIGVVELRDHSDYNSKEICDTIINKEVSSKNELKHLLEEAGLPEECFWNVRLYELLDFQDAHNNGDCFDAISFIKVGFDIGADNRLVDF